MPGEIAPPSQPAPSDLPHLARYDVVRRLGEGGMGIVFEAIERERGTRVALKMLRRLDADTLLRLKEEFRALQDLEHPNLIRLGELTCDEGTWFFTMELVDGEHFQAWLRQHGGDQSATRKAFAQLARGLVALHAAGKVHRDVKPSNVLVAKDGRVVLVDFGLVRDATRATPDEDDMLVGTISHMAPEQALGEEVGPPSDWYAVGAILYEHLAGRAPYDGSATEIVSQKIGRDPPPPHTIASDVPADLDALCMELLARDPTQRPAGAEVLRRIEARRGSDQPKRTTTVAAGAPFVGR